MEVAIKRVLLSLSWGVQYYVCNTLYCIHISERQNCFKLILYAQDVCTIKRYVSFIVNEMEPTSRRDVAQIVLEIAFYVASRRDKPTLSYVNRRVMYKTTLLPPTYHVTVDILLQCCLLRTSLSTLCLQPHWRGKTRDLLK